jgi:hypothetical protein
MAPGASDHRLSDEDYDAILAAVMETERGRWFLARYAAANRHADTQTLLDAIGHLEAVMLDSRSPAPGPVPAPPGFDPSPLPADLADRIARLRDEVAGSLIPTETRPAPDAEGLDVVGDSLMRANADILRAAEQIQEIAWTLRESGLDSPDCETLDKLATDIYGASTVCDLSVTRARMLVQALRAIEAELRGDPVPQSTRSDRDEVEQASAPSHVELAPSSQPARRSALIVDDDIMVVEDSLLAQPRPTEPKPSLSGFAGIDALSAAEKALRFT